MKIDKGANWQSSNTQVFWGEIAPCNHLVQIYENDEVFMHSLEEFAAHGIDTGEAVIIIATEDHLKELEKHLLSRGLNLEALMADNLYIPLCAEKTLSSFMVIGWPDKELFSQMVTHLVNRAKGKGRRVRAFGEMVALLWAKGQSGATVQLEYLWNKFCETEDFCLFCAYPKSGFTDDPHTSMTHICSTHTKVIAGWKPENKSEIVYQQGGY